MKKQAVTQTTALFKEADDTQHTAIRKVFEVYDDSQEWRVISICFIYPDAEFTLPVITKDGWAVPETWEFVSETFDYSRQAITQNP